MDLPSCSNYFDVLVPIGDGSCDWVQFNQNRGDTPRSGKSAYGANRNTTCRFVSARTTPKGYSQRNELACRGTP